MSFDDRGHRPPDASPRALPRDGEHSRRRRRLGHEEIVAQNGLTDRREVKVDGLLHRV